MPPMTSLLSATDAILASFNRSPIVESFGFLWQVLLLGIVLIEGAIIARLYKWSFWHALLTALWINVATGILGIGPALGGESLARAAIGRLSIWDAFRLWPLFGLGLFLAFYLATFLVEAALLHARARRVSPLNRFRKALKVSALFNAATFLLFVPFWSIAMSASLRGATFVHKSEWLPEISEVFIYERPDGALWLATTRGERLGQICQQQPYARDIAFKISDDGRSLIVLKYTVTDNEVLDADADAPAVASTTEIARYDLSSLDPELLGNVRPGATAGLPWRDALGHVQGYQGLCLRDGTFADSTRFSTPSLFLHSERYREEYREGKSQTILLDAELKGPPAPVVWPNELNYDYRCRLLLWGRRGLMWRLWFGFANVLPGGRYVLLECSGEIMVFDIKERLLVSLFRGRKPIALSSFEPRDEEEARVSTD